MKNYEKFDGKADVYALARPSYPDKLIDLITKNVGKNRTIADIGSGTGKLTAALLERGYTVYAVEPGLDMRLQAEKLLSRYANFHSVNGSAENTTLPSATADTVTAAQAFHWFDPKAFKRECLRILKPHGKVFLVWNMRDTSAEINILTAELIRRFCPKFVSFNGGVKEDDERVVAFFDGNLSREVFTGNLVYDREKFAGRCLSSSYALKEGDENYDEYVFALGEFFDRHAISGKLEVPNKTVAFYGTIR